MINLQDLTTSQLNRIIAIKEQIETLQSEMESIANDGIETSAQTSVPVKEAGKRRMSAAGRARIAAAATARWAKAKAAGQSTL